jgi:hypothetical protein
MAAKRAKQPKVRVATSVSLADAKRLEQIVKAFVASQPGSRIRRSDALRAVVQLGLEAVERDGGKRTRRQ